MRILHIYRTYYPDSQGGIQQAIRHICLATQAYATESRIFTLSPNPSPKKISSTEGLVIRSKSWMAPASCDLSGISSLLEYQELVAWADVIHYHFPWPFFDILELFNFSKKPCVLTYHSDIVRQKFMNKFYTMLMHRTLRAMSAIIATSPNYLNSSPVLRRYFLQDKVTMIPLGMARFQSEQMNLDEFTSDYLQQVGVKSGEYLLFIGVLRYYKGVHNLIAAAKSIDSSIVVAGDGPQAKIIRELSKLNKLTNIIFLGEVSEEQKHVLLRNCLALVLPSHLRSEAFGMVLIEASMFAIPMISCEIGSGTSYVNIHGKTGLVIPPSDPAALSEACNRLIKDRVLTNQMGKAALERYEELFSITALGKAHINLYSKLLNVCHSRV
jgi:glycosyltransferase involved in cell wall biosynthesis